MPSRLNNAFRLVYTSISITNTVCIIREKHKNMYIFCSDAEKENNCNIVAGATARIGRKLEPLYIHNTDTRDGST